MIEEPRSSDKPGSSTRLVGKLKSSRHGECARFCGLNIVLELVSPRSCFDHSVLPFDVAQGGEPVEPFRISNFVLRI